jgi:DNA-directed RNA polymerase specialized sigma subunit
MRAVTQKNFRVKKERKDRKYKEKVNSRNQEIIDLLSGFHLWEEWSLTHFCNLTEKERTVITGYYQNNSTREIGMLIRSGPATVNAVYKRAVSKLRNSGPDYYLWLMHQFITKSKRKDLPGKEM